MLTLRWKFIENMILLQTYLVIFLGLGSIWAAFWIFSVKVDPQVWSEYILKATEIYAKLPIFWIDRKPPQLNDHKSATDIVNFATQESLQA